MAMRNAHKCTNCGPFYGSNKCPNCKKIALSLCLHCMEVTTRKNVPLSKEIRESLGMSEFDDVGTHVCQACAYEEGRNGSTDHGYGPICAAYGCTTYLNRYNGQGLCHLHARMQGHKKMCQKCGEALEYGNPGPYCVSHGRCSDCGKRVIGGVFCGDCAPQTAGTLFSKARAQRNPRLVLAAIEEVKVFRNDVTEDMKSGKMEKIWGERLIDLCDQAIGSVEKGVEMGVAEFIEKYDSYYQEL